MATTPTQQTSWVPYGSTKDCSMGFCSIYCPQWCYVVFPPPPPIEFDDEGSSRTLSPIVIAVIGILASAFLLFSYYAIVSRYCGAFDSLRNRLHGPAGEHGRRLPGHARDEEELWETPPPDGIEEALINKITVYKYKRSDGFVDGNDCSVCLSEFREDDSLRLLPRCSHAFHIQCIDTWLKSHSNCPLCRANIHWPTWTPPPAAQLPPLQEANRAPAAREGRRQDEIVVVIDDLVIGGEEDHHHQPPNSGGAPKDDGQNRRGSGGPEGSNAVVDIKEDVAEPARRSSPLDESARGRVPMADVLGSSAAEGELMASVAADGPSEREHGMGKDNSRSRGLHRAMTDPEPAKRSPSSTGMFCLTRNGKGRSSSNPSA